MKTIACRLAGIIRQAGSKRWWKLFWNPPYIERFYNVYADIIVYSKNENLHGEHLAHVLTARSVVNFKHSELFKNRVTFLGRVLDGTTKNTKEQSVTRITKLVKPYDINSLRVVLGLAGHFWAFIKVYALKTWYSVIVWPVTDDNSAND